MSARYSIMEIFATIQGEGLNAGTPAVFVRFAGCNLDCSWCDTEWKRGAYSLTLDDLVLDICKVHRGQPLIVFTGGEPGLQLDSELVQQVKKHFAVVAIESNGTVDLSPLGLDFITISPKPSEPNSELVQRWCTEVKYVISPGDNLPTVPRNLTVLEAKFISPVTHPDRPGMRAFNQASIDHCITLLTQHPQRGWRISLQTHKLLGVR